MREPIDAFAYAPQILAALKRGVLLTAQADGEVNPMTIGWGMLGIEWGRPLFICYVRSGRYTHGLLERSDCFTVNIPLPASDGAFDAAADERARAIAAACGTTSGRDRNKVDDLGLSLVAGESVDAPAIRELPLTLECRILYRRDQDISLLPDAIRARNYPADVPGTETGSNRDTHTAYYGEIVGAYIVR